MAQCHTMPLSRHWHTMTQPFVTLSEAVQVFGISKRTIERKIASGEIGRDQIRHEGGKRLFMMAELIRVF
jgi:DeoR/GlpR family transcriptional regulator of sugar metabolism